MKETHIGIIVNEKRSPGTGKDAVVVNKVHDAVDPPVVMRANDVEVVLVVRVGEDVAVAAADLEHLLGVVVEDLLQPEEVGVEAGRGDVGAEVDGVGAGDEGAVGVEGVVGVVKVVVAGGYHVGSLFFVGVRGVEDVACQAEEGGDDLEDHRDFFAVFPSSSFFSLCGRFGVSVNRERQASS